MQDRIEPLNDSWIKTRKLEDEPGVHITGKYKRPFISARTQLKIGAACFLVMFLYFRVTLGSNDIFSLSVVAFSFAPLIYVFVFWLVVRPILMLTPQIIDVKILAEHVQIKKGRKYRTYARNVPLEFRVEQHHKAAQEELQEQKRGKPSNRYYREAIEVVMQYGEKRISIAEMRMVDLEKAKALVIRLQSWCESFDQAVKGMADGKIKPAGANLGTVSGGDFGPAPDIR